MEECKYIFRNRFSVIYIFSNEVRIETKLFTTNLNRSQITMTRNSLCRSRAENVLILHTLFEKPIFTKGLRPYTETQKSHRQGGGQLFPLVCFRETHRGFQRIHSSTNKGNNSAISCIHSAYTLHTLLFVHCLFSMSWFEKLKFYKRSKT